MASKNLYTFPNLIQFAQEKMRYLQQEGDTSKVFDRSKMNQGTKLARYAKDCPHGDENDKLFIKQVLRRILTECSPQGSDSFPARYGITHENIDQVVDWKSPQNVDPYLKFLAVLLHYKQTYGHKALGKMIDSYGWTTLRDISDDERGYYVDKEDVNSMWNWEHLDMGYDEKLDVIVQIVYEELKGNSCIDEIMYQDVGDISIGVSGIPDTISTGETYNASPAYEGAWVRYNGFSIHFRFLTFGSYENLKRVVKQGVSYAMKGEFSEKEGFKLGYGKDGSRRSAAIEPFGESPALWVRKFTAKNESNEALFNGQAGAERVMAVERALVRGGATIPVCGAQGSGKTTKMEALVKYCQPFYSIRVLESEFEARLRWKYPHKNIYTMESNESSQVKPSDAYNFTLRTAGDIYIVGEARSDDMIVNVTRTANRGGRAVYFTFHPNTPAATIPEIANAMIREKMYTNLKDAVATALETVKVCIFVRMDLEQQCRYYEIHEFVPRDNRIPNEFMAEGLPPEVAQRKFMESMYAYMKAMTSADTYYDTVPIVTFDRRDKIYKFRNTISDRLFNYLLDNSPLTYEKEELTALFRPVDRFRDYMRDKDLPPKACTPEQIAKIAKDLNLNPAFYTLQQLTEVDIS